MSRSLPSCSLKEKLPVRSGLRSDGFVNPHEVELVDSRMTNFFSQVGRTRILAQREEISLARYSPRCSPRTIVAVMSEMARTTGQLEETAKKD